MLREERCFGPSCVSWLDVEEAFGLPYESTWECVEESPSLPPQRNVHKQAVKIAFNELESLSFRSGAELASSFGDVELEELPEDLMWRFCC